MLVRHDKRLAALFLWIALLLVGALLVLSLTAAH
jgi:hypothetical protein